MATSKMKLPRKGTRVRAVFDRLYKDFSLIRNTSWSAAKAAYDNAPPAYPPEPGTWAKGAMVPHNSRKYSSMEVSRILRKYATRVSRGQYEMKPEWVKFIDGQIGIVEMKPDNEPVITQKIDAALKEIGGHYPGRIIPRSCDNPSCTLCGGVSQNPCAEIKLPSEVDSLQKKLFDADVKITVLESKLKSAEVELGFKRGSRDGYMKAADDKIEQLKQKINAAIAALQ